MDNSSEELTPKQRYQRDYYARNKEKICSAKREKYAKDSKPKRLPGTSKRVAKNPPSLAGGQNRALQFHQRKLHQLRRPTVEDIKLAEELDITVEELLS